MITQLSIGVGDATGIRVGQALAEGDTAAAKTAAKVGCLLIGKYHYLPLIKISSFIC